MRFIILLGVILNCTLVQAQEHIVTTDDNLSLQKIQIAVSKENCDDITGSKGELDLAASLKKAFADLALFSLVKDGKVQTTNLPNESGLYTIFINYTDSLHFNELIILHPNNQYTFAFYLQHGKVFCRISTEYNPGESREIVLNSLSESDRKLRDLLNSDR
ncbi:MAG: hypothetical protein AAFX87_23795 [Bacteroidota bacterium]